MGRVWALMGGLMAVSVILYIFNGFMGIQGMLTIGLCIGAGAATAYIQGRPSLGRGMYMFGGVFIGALGFLMGAMAFPDTALGLALGAFVPQAIIGFAAMWSRRQEMAVAAIIGSGAIAGVYANDFDLDPQAINYALPIAIGQTILPMGLGYLAAILVRTFVPDDPPRVGEGGPAAPAGGGETMSWDAMNDDTAQMNFEVTK